MTKDELAKHLRNADEKFDLLYNITNGAIEMFQVPNMTSYSVCMAIIETILRDGKKHAKNDTMTLLCDLMTGLAEKYNPEPGKPSAKEPSLSAVEACKKVWGMSRNEALEWLESDAGVYIPMGGEVRWMSGAAIKSLLEKVCSE